RSAPTTNRASKGRTTGGLDGYDGAHLVKDIVVVGLVVLAFAVLLTVHVAIAFGLLGRRPRWRGLVALLVVPLAPFWAWRERMRVRAGLWAAAALVYVVARVIASV